MPRSQRSRSPGDPRRTLSGGDDLLYPAATPARGRTDRAPARMTFALACFVGIALEMFTRGACYLPRGAAALPYIRPDRRPIRVPPVKDALI